CWFIGGPRWPRGAGNGTSCLGRADYTCNVLLVWGERGLLPLRRPSQSLKTAGFWRYLSPMSPTRSAWRPPPRKDGQRIQGNVGFFGGSCRLWAGCIGVTL